MGAARGTTKRLSVEQEEAVAQRYGGRLTKGSGAVDNDQGDVRTPTMLIECKMSQKPPKKLIEEFEKIAREAWSEGREPMMALRYWAPDSILADHDGWIDLSVRRTCDDIERETHIQDEALKRYEHT